MGVAGSPASASMCTQWAKHASGRVYRRGMADRGAGAARTNVFVRSIERKRLSRLSIMVELSDFTSRAAWRIADVQSPAKVAHTAIIELITSISHSLASIVSRRPDTNVLFHESDVRLYTNDFRFAFGCLPITKVAYPPILAEEAHEAATDPPGVQRSLSPTKAQKVERSRTRFMTLGATSQVNKGSGCSLRTWES